MSSHYHSYLPPTSGDTQLPVDKSNNNYKCPVNNNNNNNNQAVKRFNQPQVLLPKGVKLLDIDSNGFNQNNSLNESTLLDQDREHFTPSFTSIQSHVQRKLLNFFFIYAIIIVSLYVTYAAYYYYQHHQWQRKSFMPTTSSKTTSDSQFQDFIHQQNAINFKSSTQNPDSMAITKQRLSQNLDSNDHQTAPMAASESELSKLFESKLHLLERYIEVIALDLQETKTRLKEREKCDCSMSCTFNGTKFTDQSTWKNQCDTCTCQSGRISCQPIQCPALTCEDSIILPGQCCPTCMRKCSYNNTLIRHGHKFNPRETTNSTTLSKGLVSRKECKCDDGRIKCIQLLSTATSIKAKQSTGQSKTIDIKLTPQANNQNSTSGWGPKSSATIKRQVDVQGQQQQHTKPSIKINLTPSIRPTDSTHHRVVE